MVPTAAETIGNASPGMYVYLLILGLAFGLPALATMTNFRGFREWHLRRSLRVQERLGFPHWWRNTDPEQLRRFGTFTQYMVASGFLLVAVVLVVIATGGLLRRAVGG